MLEMKTIGKPCAGEPHARFDEEARVTVGYSGFTLSEAGIYSFIHIILKIELVKTLNPTITTFAI